MRYLKDYFGKFSGISRGSFVCLFARRSDPFGSMYVRVNTEYAPLQIIDAFWNLIIFFTMPIW